jgi:hypothetical protein
VDQEDALTKALRNTIREEFERMSKEEAPGPTGEAAAKAESSLEPHTKSALLDGIGPEDLELTADTFNPSALFNDKTQAEWFGNIVANASKDAFKGIISQAQKLPRWVWILVLFAGAMLGFVFAIWLMGGVGTHAAATSAGSTGSGSNLPIPPPPNFTTTTTTTTGG